MTDDKSRDQESADQLVSNIAERLVSLVEHFGIDRDTLIDALRNSPPRQECLGETPQADIAPATVSFLSTLLSLWRSSPEYVDDLGNPSHLPRVGTPLSLESLFQQTKRRFPNLDESSLSFDEILERLIQSGAVVQTENGYTMKQYSVSMRNPGTASSLGYLLLLDDFLATTLHNAKAGPDDTTIFQRRAYSLAFPPEQLPLLTRLLRDEGMTMLQSIESMIEKHERTETATDGNNIRVGVGLYMYQDQAEQLTDT